VLPPGEALKLRPPLTKGVLTMRTAAESCGEMRFAGPKGENAQGWRRCKAFQFRAPVLAKGGRGGFTIFSPAEQSQGGMRWSRLSVKDFHVDKGSV